MANKEMALIRERYLSWLKKEREKEHKENYIYWRGEAKSITLSPTEYHDKLIEIRSKYTLLDSSKYNRTDRKNFVDGTYDEYVPKRSRGFEYRIYLYADGEYTIYRCRRDGKSIANKGEKAVKLVVNRFQERTGLGRQAMYNAFGTAPIDWKVCTQKALYYICPLYQSTDVNRIKIIDNVNSVDGCSQYPTAICDRLPTTKGYKQVEGTVKPTEEYPFALYLKTGHVAVYNEFDTHDWLYHRMAIKLFRNEFDVKTNPDYPFTYKYLLQFNPDDDITILMKESEYTFKEEMEYFFNIKEQAPKDSKERAEAKLVMNAFVGMFHQSNPRSYDKFAYCHLSNIAIARANDRLIKVSDKINIEDIIHICVDGIIYKGKQILGVKERKLGNFEQEFSDCKGVFTAINTYMIKNKDNEVEKYKHGASDTYKSSGKLIDDDPPTQYEQMFDYTRTDNSSHWDKNEKYRRKEI